MKKETIHIEHELRSNSENIIWSLISTASGMQKWLADNVDDYDAETLIFTWGNTWSHHEIRKAKILKLKKNQSIRFRWEDEEEKEAYIELKMNWNELTNDYILSITDYALPEDKESIISWWEDCLDRLHQTTGL